MKQTILALVVKYEGSQPALLETLSDGHEIALLESTLKSQSSRSDADLLARIYDERRKREREDDEFGNYVEDLLSQPFLRPDIQEHGVQWLKSKIRIEQFEKTESEAAQVIADYAYKLFLSDPTLKDFSLAGPATTIRVRVFVVAA